MDEIIIKYLHDELTQAEISELFHQLNSDKLLNTLFIPAEQRAQLTLQDGTEVWLNAQSTLKYPSAFSKKSREVEIIGEGLFNLRKILLFKTGETDGSLLKCCYSTNVK